MPEVADQADEVAIADRGEHWAGPPLSAVPPIRDAVPADRLEAPRTVDGHRVREGYRLRVAADEIVIASSDAAGARHARTRIDQLAAAADLRCGCATDWPSMAVRGVIEGFYGDPWTHDQRLRMVEEIGRWRMNTYVYAPKNDPHHRSQWRSPYPRDEAARIAELAAAASESGVEFVYAIHPGLDIIHSDHADHGALVARAQELYGLGVRRFAVLFDDIAGGLSSAVDRARFGEGAKGAGRAQAATLARFDADALTPLGLGGTLLTVPTEYAGMVASDYREAFGAGVPPGTGVMWTGSDIVVGEIEAEDARAARAAFLDTPLIIWDNFPVNDFDRSRAFLGPLQGRDPQLAEAGVVGILTNPMVEYEPSRFAMCTVAAWAWDPFTYDPDAAAETALLAVAGADAELLRPLVAAASTWPPSAPQYPRLAEAVDEAFARQGETDETLEALLAGLRACASLDLTTPLRTALGPWLIAAGTTAAVIDAALAHHRGEFGAYEVRSRWETARTAEHGIARDVARGAVGRALGRTIPDWTETEPPTA